MSDLYPPFLKWGECKSKDENNPDILHIEVLDTETFETEYNICVRAMVDEIEMNVPLQNFGSKNMQLLNKWNENVRSGKIVQGKKFKIKTWLGTSKNNFPIRRYELVF